MIQVIEVLEIESISLHQVSYHREKYTFKNKISLLDMHKDRTWRDIFVFFRVFIIYLFFWVCSRLMDPRVYFLKLSSILIISSIMEKEKV